MRILILGAGDVGTHLARVLSMVGEVVVMDRSPDALAQIEESLDVLTVKGDVTHRRSLLGVDAHKTELVVAVTGSDDTNLIGAALAAELGAERTVARVDDPNFYDSKAGIEEGILGVHAVLCASLLVGQELLRLIAAEDADATCILARGSLMLTALKLRGSEPVCGEKVSDLELPALTRIELVQRDGRALRPVEVARFEVGDELLVMGPPVAAIQGTRKIRGLPPKRGMLIGGGDVGMQLGKLLGQLERRVQIVERSAPRAEQLAEELPHVNVILGDGSSIATLRDEHIGTADYVVAVTRSDEVNLMACLLARDLGVQATYTLLHRHGYDEVYRHLGVRGTTGPHDVLAAAVTQFLPSDQAPPVPFGNTGLDCRELRLPTAGAFSRPVQDLALPAGIHLVGRAWRGRSLEPTHPLTPGQSLVFVAPRDKRAALDRRLKRLLLELA